MKPLCCAFWLAMIFVCANNPLQAAFLLTADSADLQFNGAGSHNVDFILTHSGVGLSTLSGYTIRFGSPANASLGLLPTGVAVTGATQVLPVSSAGLFNFNLSSNTVAASSVIGDTNLGISGTATLFTLALNLGSAASYTIGVDFQNAQRGGLLATEIGNEFFNPNSPTTDFSFVLQNISAVPEPSAMILMATLPALGAFRNRRKLLKRKILCLAPQRHGD